MRPRTHAERSVFVPQDGRVRTARPRPRSRQSAPCGITRSLPRWRTCTVGTSTGTCMLISGLSRARRTRPAASARSVPRRSPPSQMNYRDVSTRARPELPGRPESRRDVARPRHAYLLATVRVCERSYSVCRRSYSGK
ncbi:hypothetical protein C2E23DRAFT_900387 [Lenzites betulinus]|nr:hypothetical protein C2E23DRAFT_900387 [Lenzites betulinus]